MHVVNLALEDFRNYEREAVELSPGLNVVVGPNAHGKTNLLEAVHCLSGLGSPRGPDAGLVREGADRALLHGSVARGTRVATIALELRRGRGAHALINGTPVPSLRGLSELGVSVFFGPDDVALVKGSPDGRRRFLDDLVVKLRPAREAVRREWERVLRQRNALLKTLRRDRGHGSSPGTLEIWNDAFCRAGAALTAARLEALGSLLPYARKRYEEIAGGGWLDLGYTSEWLGEDSAREALESVGSVDEAGFAELLTVRTTALRGREIERGMSLVGPQRDDISVRLASPSGAPPFDARSFASQGDQRSAALALKLGERDLLSEVLGEQPILLLDDVFSELDPDRRGWLAEAVGSGGQTLLSSAEPDAAELAGGDRVIRVKQGGLSVDEQ